MAQFSLPQAGLVTVGDGVDCGPYTANQWAAILIAANRSGGMIVTGAASPPGLPATQTVPNVGVFYAYADRLEVTSPAAAQISIATGVSIVDGRVHRNDTAITATAITIPAGVANSRIDRVVVRMNYTLVDYTSVNAPALVVDFNTARICIISGTEAVGPGAPTLTQDEDRATYWDIPLAQYEIIHTTGVISDLTDQREWVDAEIKMAWVSVAGGEQTTGGGAGIISPTYSGVRGRYIELPDSETSRGSALWSIPHDYISSLNVEGVILGRVTGGNIYASNYVSVGTCGELPTSNNSGLAAEAITAITSAWSCHRSFDAPDIAAVRDVVQLIFLRDAGDALDTVNAEVDFFGWFVQYLGWGRR